MLQFQVLTLFPELFTAFQAVGLVSRGIKEGLIGIRTVHLRDFAMNTHGQVDDTPYGGGSGMILRPEPAVGAIEDAKAKDPQAKVVLLSPRGQLFNQQFARNVITSYEQSGGGLILLCGRYEGIDERVAEHFVDYQVSIGDFILMGGEIPAMAMIETTARLLPGLLGNADSIVGESFELNLLEYPQYTKPQNFRGHEVPSILLSGHHREIAGFRKDQAIKETIQRRPDLLSKGFGRRLTTNGFPCEVSLALIHHPVLDKQGDIITSSLTNLDLHDIARSVKTFGLNHFYISHPVKALRRLAQKICEHWATGYGATYNPNRSEALEVIFLVSDFDDILFDIEARTGKLPKVITTSARKTEKALSFPSLQAMLMSLEEPYLIVLGTGWGLAPELLSRADFHLEPISGATDYNHLSVRSAAAIVLDRLFAVEVRCA